MCSRQQIEIQICGNNVEDTKTNLFCVNPIDARLICNRCIASIVILGSICPPLHYIKKKKKQDLTNLKTAFYNLEIAVILPFIS